MYQCHPFAFHMARNRLEAGCGKGGCYLFFFNIDDTTTNEQTPRLECGCQIGCKRDQHSGNEVGRYQIERGLQPSFRAGQGLPPPGPKSPERQCPIA